MSSLLTLVSSATAPVLFAFVAFAGCGAAAAEDISVSPLSDEQLAAIAEIAEGNVLATVAFLASDEMAGRNTPSLELNVAGAYVAARFLGAGLEGLGPAGSYYQTTEITQYLMPKQGAKITVAGQPIVTKGIFFGGEKEGDVTAPRSDGSDPLKVPGHVVILDEFALPPQAIDNPAMLIAVWSRRIASLANNGAATILVRTADDSILPEAVARLHDKPVTISPRFLVPCPVILISKDPLPEGDITVHVPARQEVATPVRNVIGVLRGSDPELAQQAVIISAHLDHIGRLEGDGQGDRINNGADDNATGVTAVLTLADTFARLKQRPRRSLIFITFWGEEKGLLGSKYYAEHPLWPLDQTVANVNIEMIGRPEENAEENAWGTGWTRSTLCPQVAAGAARCGVHIFHREDVAEMLYTRSDNYSLAEKGVIAHSFSAGSLHSDYHQPSDEVSRLNLPHMTSIIRGLFAGTLPIADGELTPQRAGQ